MRWLKRLLGMGEKLHVPKAPHYPVPVAPPVTISMPEIDWALGFDEHGDERTFKAEARWRRAGVRHGHVDRDDYEAFLDFWIGDLEEQIESLKFERSVNVIDAAEYRESVGEAKDNLKEARRLLVELNDADSLMAEPVDYDQWAEGETGKWCRFDYENADGEKSRRNVTMWESSGRMIIGYCRTRKEERNFRKDRITNWQSG